MARYIVGLNQIGQTLMADITKFSIDIGQGSDPERNLMIYREIIAQIVSMFQLDRANYIYDIQQLPHWKTIIYLDEREVNISAQKSYFRDRIILAAIAIFEEIYKHVAEPMQSGGRGQTFLLESSSVTMLMINVFAEP